MDDRLIMHILESQHYAGDHELSLDLCEASTFSYVVPKVSSC